MSAFRRTVTSGLAVTPLALLVGCSPAPRGGPPVPIQGVSHTLIVNGEYAPVAVDRVDRLSIEGRTLVLHGATDVAVDLPPRAGAPEPIGRWALVTETEAGSRRALTFTHETTLDDFTIELPASDAPVHYGMLAGQSGEEVMVFAWGSRSRSYRGYVTIARR